MGACKDAHIRLSESKEEKMLFLNEKSTRIGETRTKMFLNKMFYILIFVIAAYWIQAANVFDASLDAKHDKYMNLDLDIESLSLYDIGNYFLFFGKRNIWEKAMRLTLSCYSERRKELCCI